MKKIEHLIKKHLQILTENVNQQMLVGHGMNKEQLKVILKNGGPINPTSITKKFIPKPNQKNFNELLNYQTDNFRYITNKNTPSDPNLMPKNEVEAIELVLSHPEVKNIPDENLFVWVEQPLKGVFKSHLIFPINTNSLYEAKHETDNYMFFSNLKQIHRQCEMLLKMDHQMIDDILTNGHDWAADHITEAKTNMDQVFDFLMNTTKKSLNEDLREAKKKNKLCSRGINAAKSKYKVYPSAYANGYAVQVCKGKIKGLDGKKKCSGSYCNKKGS